MKIVIVCVVCSLCCFALGMFAENQRHDCGALDLYRLTPEWVSEFASQEVYYVSFNKVRRSPVGQYIALRWDWIGNKLEVPFYVTEDSAKLALCRELNVLREDLEREIGDCGKDGK